MHHETLQLAAQSYRSQLRPRQESNEDLRLRLEFELAEAREARATAEERALTFIG